MELPILPRLPGELKAVTFWGRRLLCITAKLTADWRLMVKSCHWRGARGGLMKIGPGIVRYGRHVVFQLAEVALRRIDDLRPRPAPLPAS